MSLIAIVALAAGNLGLIFFLMTVRLRHRTVRAVALVQAPPERLWLALWPLGEQAGWSGEILSARALPGSRDVCQTLSWEGRDGQPIQRRVRLEDVREGEGFTLRVVEDTSLDPSFWAGFCETVRLEPAGEGTRVTIAQTDSYRGAAFLILRFFALRRRLGKLKLWAETGRYRKGGLFEHPLSQFGLAALSALILWPFFGLTVGGFALAAILTAVVALHELGHMAAFRLSGHRRVRMIFIPLLGGIALGGRPYDSRFEVAFVALMGAGFSAFLVPLAIAASMAAALEGFRFTGALLATLAGFTALFNIANLVPVWKFDGGQILRQICPGPVSLALASFGLLGALLAVGFAAGFSYPFLLAAGAVFAVLSLLTAGSGVKPRHDLKPIGAFERAALALALVAVFAIHGFGVLWAAARLA